MGRDKKCIEDNYWNYINKPFCLYRWCVIISKKTEYMHKHKYKHLPNRWIDYISMFLSLSLPVSICIYNIYIYNIYICLYPYLSISYSRRKRRIERYTTHWSALQMSGIAESGPLPEQRGDVIQVFNSLYWEPGNQLFKPYSAVS